MAGSPLPPIPSRLIDVEVVTGQRRGTPLAVLVASGEDTAAASSPRDGLPWRTATPPTGKAGEVLPAAEPALGWLLGVGSGQPRHYRSAGAALARAASARIAAETDAGARPSRTVELRLPEGLGADAVRELVLGVALGGYRFVVSAEKPPASLRRVRLVVGEGTALETITAYTDAAAKARELAAASSLARDLANAPSNVKDPAWLAGTAERVLGGQHGLRVTVRDATWLAEHQFGGILAVGGGSASPPRLVELSYAPRGASTHLVYVGKGITFDTGGISVKPNAGMNMMRTDMAGGAAVIAAMRAIVTLRPTVRVTALIPAAENHLSGSAYRPGDVVRHYGGQTSEVSNTDAEGRMVMADALAYGARRFTPDAILDVATLTGAMKVALGVRTGGVFASDDDLAERVTAAGERTGEAWWRMPLLADHAASVQGELADVRQAPPGPGAITAALFLREFTGGLPWAHLDIAGPARAEANYDDVVAGGTGFAARTLVELAVSYG